MTVIEAETLQNEKKNTVVRVKSAVFVLTAFLLVCYKVFIFAAINPDTIIKKTFR